MSELNEKNKNNELNDQDLDEVSGGLGFAESSKAPCFTPPEINSVASQQPPEAWVNKANDKGV